MRRGIVIGSALGALIAYLVFLRPPGILSPSPGEDVANHKEEAKAGIEGILAPKRIITKSLFFEQYGSSNRSVANDLEAVSLLLNDCQLMMKDFESQFLPDNRAITSFLSGGNREGIAWIPPAHPSINDLGELTDRFGGSLFFHREAALKFQLRSAGRDQIMWTSDDVVYPDGSAISQDD